MAFESKKLINNPNDVVTEFIEGLVETYPGLQYLDGFPEVKVVLRADVSPSTYDKVAVISGGGSGHEPAHAGFVGDGMLTAAICGDVFASPPVASILAGIRAVTGPMGCLLIVKNYTGDRLNFGLAAEEAKAEGYKVEMVIVGDDCALPPPLGIAGRRGLAGTILVHKVAGAAAASGLSLSEVASEARHACGIVGTMGVALSVCTLPGQPKSDRLGPGKMELGLGIHGEPGAIVADIQPVDLVVSHVLNRILSEETNYVPIKRGSRVVLMINGLGSTPVMELMIAAGKAVPILQLEHGLAVVRVYTGSFMTSLDMAGFSISIMKAEAAILKRLDAATKAPHWPVGVDGDHPPAKIPVPVPVPPSRSTKSHELLSRPQELNEQGRALEIAIEAATLAIINLKDSLNEWDSKVGDGDCGSTMCRGATAIQEDLKKYYPLNDAAETINEIGSSIRRVMGGTSGILYDIFCKAAYAQLKPNNQSEITPLQWADAFEGAISAVMLYGGAAAGYRTMLDALIPASTLLKQRLTIGDDPLDAFLTSSHAAIEGAESTKHMEAQAGRSTYVSTDILKSVPDPGAMAAASWYRAAALALKQASLSP
ncbi:putative phosphotransferase with an alcohol group as acceptor, FAD-AMP lyase (cyclizing) [Helianthus annuus]|uniref:Phosphotransferase with an alcohol group as acceptor, FAD-AMP lyase (Cyclizing) n=1 Tax=Helianthus annuus TaxID=4232 RepID=A0A251VC08_HELAN|nr:putative 3,4-dihydroxy-2-butanone kinase [Helianthus annuus]KAF5795662.1 putative phosphotransferase with an alcohol group as acceptor, FAD-AMP lyase (cyclizing) [Helianthus annuus]KAJ0539127.1 putative phosphotransferase with an alcohol group as acceptor, FAD-AMP lyase (cyclizing) [Helianthus annuus]KAJ0547206.1 putative phosphotransferase with an alcohol group as acceptor, FAD-AMP lyase (cyclizing) [Helianthus annuus]KAJ0553777.1 putative phosphotransferase with an alcohol group as accepto